MIGVRNRSRSGRRAAGRRAGESHGRRGRFPRRPDARLSTRRPDSLDPLRVGRQPALQRRLADLCSSSSSFTPAARRSRTRRSCCSARSPIGWWRRPAARDYGVLVGPDRSPRDGEAAAHAAAGRLPAGAEGPLGARPPAVSRPRAARPRRSGVRGRGPGRLHAAPEDPGERPPRVLGDERRTRVRRARTEARERTRVFRPAMVVLRTADIDGARRPETLTIAEFARLADAYSVGISLSCAIFRQLSCT